MIAAAYESKAAFDDAMEEGGGFERATNDG